ncbi:hypothetical protein C6P40_002822 [Pichia californica]|uniref:Zn(2)-C6 fungal-type domain-containing protein n=1 Tax=Pichia californica TaxID=460514 RepID=A0A9P6WNP7_9ASCO|nr:hypothetical protein C6P42_004492 [[Candida] californica]KAG0690447.1 hypothetical protein C6P40_002822 [[Candida] californica]
MSKVKKPKKIYRQSKVCMHCKIKKIKCDRKKPCSNCIKNSSINSCIYDDGKDYTSINEKSTRNESILDIEFRYSRLSIIMQKPSNSFLCPFIFSTKSKDHIISYHYLFKFRNLISKEKILWKSTNLFNDNVDISNLEIDNYNSNSNNNNSLNFNEINRLIESLILNNYHSILERLNYFQLELNKLYFDSCIPMGVIQLIFQYYFNLTPISMKFNYPKKQFEYSMISLIFSIVELSNKFAIHNDFKFNFQLLNNENKNFKKLSLKLLNFSYFKRRRNLFSVYTLLIMRLLSSKNGDIQCVGEYIWNSHHLFVSAVNLCMDMGLYVNLDNSFNYEKLESNGDQRPVSFFKEISTEQKKRLWNYILKLDCFYFIDTSIPPIIDNRYCHSYYTNIFDSCLITCEFVKLIPEIAIDILSNNNNIITFNKLLNSTKKIIKLLSKLPSLKNFQKDEKNKSVWNLYYLKFILFKLLFIYQFQIISLLDDSALNLNFNENILKNSNNKLIITSLKNECYLKCKLIYISVIDTIIGSPKGSLSKEYTFYNIENLSSWIGVKTIYFIDLIFSISTPISLNQSKNESIESFELPNPPIFDSQLLENLLYDFNINKNLKNLNKFENNLKPSLLISFMTNIYENLLKLKGFYSNSKLFFMTKYFLLTLYFLYAYLHYFSEPGFNIISNFDKVINKTQHLLSNIFNKENPTFLLSPNQMINCLNQMENKGNNDNQNNSIFNNEDSNNLSSFNFNDIASSIFSDETMISFFKDIDDIFNKE